jgi:hypothetical protein
MGQSIVWKRLTTLHKVSPLLRGTSNHSARKVASVAEKVASVAGKVASVAGKPEPLCAKSRHGCGKRSTISRQLSSPIASTCAPTESTS